MSLAARIRRRPQSRECLPRATSRTRSFVKRSRLLEWAAWLRSRRKSSSRHRRKPWMRARPNNGGVAGPVGGGRGGRPADGDRGGEYNRGERGGGDNITWARALYVSP